MPFPQTNNITVQPTSITTIILTTAPGNNTMYLGQKQSVQSLLIYPKPSADTAVVKVTGNSNFQFQASELAAASDRDSVALTFTQSDVVMIQALDDYLELLVEVTTGTAQVLMQF